MVTPHTASLFAPILAPPSQPLLLSHVPLLAKEQLPARFLPPTQLAQQRLHLTTVLLHDLRPAGLHGAGESAILNT